MQIDYKFCENKSYNYFGEFMGHGRILLSISLVFMFFISCGGRKGPVQLPDFNPTEMNPLDYRFSEAERNNSPELEHSFNETIDEVFEIFSPIFKSMDKIVKVKKDWLNQRQNAYVMMYPSGYGEREFSEVVFYGGLLRFPGMNADSLALVACHEIGHIIGGSPVSISGDFIFSVEGQADYFATAKCAKLFFGPKNNELWLKNQPFIDNDIQRMCFNDDNMPLCTRILMASKKLARFFTNHSPEFRLSVLTPSKVKAKKTWVIHPDAQCRLDTFVQGYFCKADETLMPKNDDPNFAYCSENNGDMAGLRPSCWYNANPGNDEN
jgi:hypothetical protein